MLNTAKELPRSDGVVEELKRIQANTFQQEHYSDLGENLRDYLNELQINIANVHRLFSATWFPSNT